MNLIVFEKDNTLFVVLVYTTMWLISIRKPKIQHLKNCNCIFAPIKVVFGSCKSISGKYFIFRKCYFPERKIFSWVWLHFKIFFENIFWYLEKKKEEAKPRKTRTNLEEHGAISRSMERSRDRRSDLAIDGAILRSTARSHEASIAIGTNGAS